MKTRRQSRRRIPEMYIMERRLLRQQQQNSKEEVKSRDEDAFLVDDECGEEKPEMWIPNELIRPQWFHDTTNDIERVQSRIKAEEIVEAIQGWSMPEVTPAPRKRPVNQILPAVLKQESNVVKREVPPAPVLKSKRIMAREAAAAGESGSMNKYKPAGAGGTGASGKSKLERFLTPTTTKTITEENKFTVDGNKRHHLDLNKIPFNIVIPGPSAAGAALSVQELVQRMADQGQLVLENGQLVFRRTQELATTAQLHPSPMSNLNSELNLSMNLLESKEEEDEYPIITKVESISSPESNNPEDAKDNNSHLKDGGVTFYFNEDEGSQQDNDNEEQLLGTRMYSVDADGFKKPALLSPYTLFRQSRKQSIKRVDPSSVVPVSVTNSTASSASESDVDLTEFPTDEDESETEFQNPNTVWVVPRQASSRSPSPNEVPEFELDEPEFILTTGSLDEIAPPKKRKQKHEPQPHTDGKIYPKPAFSYSCLIAMSLKNSKTGSLPVSEIYKFMCDHFPYFKSAPSGWKNSVRHNLSLNKCFEKIEKPGNGARKGCLWALNPAKIHKMDEEVQKWLRKDPLAIRRAMSDPENLELIERGELKRDYSGNGASDEDDEEDISEPCTPLTQAQLLARRSRGNSSDSMGDTTMSSTTPTTTVSQVQAITLSRPIEQKIHVKSEPMDTLDFGTITNVQGNYLCHTGAGTGTYTLSFSTMNNATTPIIIRRTPVK